MVARTARTEKLDLRLTAAAKQKLQAAAEAKHCSVTEFVMRSAIDRADEVLSDQRRFFVNEAQWQAFQAALDAPPRDLPELQKFLSTPSVVELSQKS